MATKFTGVRDGVRTAATCPRCRTHRLFTMPSTGERMCGDQVHCRYVSTENPERGAGRWSS
jgi:uncharacterized protein (DUF983 family)